LVLEERSSATFSGFSPLISYMNHPVYVTPTLTLGSLL
jgi:hypothetical protein